MPRVLIRDSVPGKYSKESKGQISRWREMSLLKPNNFVMECPMTKLEVSKSKTRQ
jgi:hypothetical protein